MSSTNLDLIILTLNEELNLEHCLRSVEGLPRNIFIVDSGSTDKTAEIARRYGARVIVHEFRTQAEQFNWALDNLPLESDWILRLDADEYLLPELKAEIASKLDKFPADITGLYLRRRMIFLGRWIRYGGYYPTWILRLFRRGKARSEEAELNEHIVLLEGVSGRMEGDFVDHDHEGLTSWSNKHVGYATRQAKFLAGLRNGSDNGFIQPQFFGPQAHRKRWLVQKVYGPSPLFVRAFLFFTYRYFFRLGFLDGMPGLIFHYLHGCWYMFYTDAKVYEQKLRQNG